MLQTSALFQALWADVNHEEETKVVIGSTTYGEDSLISVTTDTGAFAGDELTIGGAVMGQITVVLRREGMSARELSATIPRMAVIRPYVRLRGRLPVAGTSAVVGQAVTGKAKVSDSLGLGEEQTSEWVPQGVYYIAERDAVGWSSQLTLYGEDNMTWAEADYPSVNHEWPATDLTVLQDIASALNITLDSRTTALVNKGYMLPEPKLYSMREELGYIAAMYGGNFIFTKEGKLLLLALNSLPQQVVT